MFQLQPIQWIAFLPQMLMYIGVFITFVYMCYKYRRDALSILIILMFYTGLFIFLGAMVANIMKIVVLGLTCWCCFDKNIWSIRKKEDVWFIVIFGVFLLVFFISVMNSSGNTTTIIFSQLARYVEFFCLYFLLREAVYRKDKLQAYLQLFYELIIVQLIITILKFILFGGQQIESFVGTFSVNGGAQGTSLPILGFIVLYFYRSGKLSKWDWLLVAGLMLIGYTAAKRAIWFILPIVIAAFLIYVRGIRLNKYLMLGLCAAPIVFYFGVRLTPTLNPEHQVWGSFDWEHVFGYAEQYQFGDEGLEAFDIQKENHISSIGGQYFTANNGTIEAQGRGNATLALVELLFSPKYTLKDQDIYGIGFSSMYSTSYDTFDKLPLTIHLAYKGAATGVFQSYVTTGYLGVFTTILLMFFPFFFFKHKRLQWVILAILAWEYFMYTGIVFRTPAFMAILLFVLHYTNKQYDDYQAVKRAERLRQLAERQDTLRKRMEAYQYTE